VLIDTVEAALTLYEIGYEGNLLDDTVGWLFAFEASQDDYLARKWRMLVHSTASTDDPFNDGHTSIYEHIASLQNPDGGWGITHQYESDPYGTLLSLEALIEAGYTDTTILENGFTYLLGQQQVDGSWTFTDEEDGNLSLSASIVALLSKYSESNTFVDPSLSSEVPVARQDGAQWIAGFRKSDGGYWMTVSNAAETSLALIALLYNGHSPGFGLNAFTYILDNQLPNGSWEEDSYTTAVALRALEFAKSLANIGVAGSDMVLLNPPAITNTIVAVDAKVRNLGGVDLTDVTLELFDKDPDVIDPGTGQLPDPISWGNPFDMPVGSTGLITFFLNTIGRLGPQEVFVVADRANTIEEIDETNNKASLTFNILLPPPSDLSTAGADSTVTLDWTPLSIPGIDPSSISGYNIYRDGNTVPLNGLEPIQSPPYVDSGLTNEQYYSYTISAVDSSGNEGPLSSPVTGIPIPPPAGIDLTLFPEELSFSPSTGNAAINDTVTINCVIRNVGLTGVGNFVIGFYDGNPGGDGQLISQEGAGPLEGGSAAAVSAQWIPASSGAHQIFISIDPNDVVSEANENNNGISQSYTVNSLPDLSVNAADIDILPARPLANDPAALVGGDPLYVNAVLRNEGGTNSGSFDAKVSVFDSGSTEVYSFLTTINLFLAGQSANLYTPPAIQLAPGDYIASNAFHVAARPDLVIPSMELVPAQFQPGSTITIRVTIENLGELDAYYPDEGGFVTKVFDIESDSLREQIGGDLKLINLDGASGTNSHTFELNYTVKSGPRFIYAVTNATGVIAEGNVNNNDHYIPINLAENLPDIVVFNNDIKIQEETPRAGQDCNVEVTVRNAGSADATDVLLRVSIRTARFRKPTKATMWQRRFSPWQKDGI
jgi:hypothetical protein